MYKIIISPILMLNFFLKEHSFNVPQKQYRFHQPPIVSTFKQVERVFQIGYNLVFPVISLPLPNSIHNKIIYHFFTNNGYVIMKFGQWLASRPDLIPIDLCQILSNLHSNAPKHSFEETIKILKNDNFSGYEFVDKNPIGSGSIAQVYKMKKSTLFEETTLQKIFNFFGLKKQHEDEKTSENKFFALKIIHPNIKSQIYLDMQILGNLSKILSKIPCFRCFDIERQFIYFKNDILKQIDFNQESNNIFLFRYKNMFNSNLIIPKPIQSGKNFLLLEYINGEQAKSFFKTEFKNTTFSSLYTKNEQIEKSIDNSEKRYFYCKNLLKFYVKSIFHDKLIYTDMHPGNIYFNKNNKLILFDYGLVKFFTDDEYKNFVDLISAIFVDRSPKIAASLIVDRLSANKDVHTEQFAQKASPIIKSIVDSFWSNEHKANKSMKTKIIKFINVCNEYGVKFDHKYNQIFISALCLDGFLQSISPDCQFYKNIWKYLWIFGPILGTTRKYIFKKYLPFQ